jgi:leucyl aminopeptidase
MQSKTKTGDIISLRSPCLVLGVFAGRHLTPAAQNVDQAVGGRLVDALRDNGMTGDTEQVMLLHALPGVVAERVLLVGLGKRKEHTLRNHLKAVEAALDELQRQRVAKALWTLHQQPPADSGPYRCVHDTALAARARAYRFDRLKSEKKPPASHLKTLDFWCSNKTLCNTADTALNHARATADGMDLARDLGNLPGNVCTPSYLAEQALALGKGSSKLKVRILEEDEMDKLGMGALLAVSRGSRQPAKLIVMDYRGGKDEKPVVLVGKGLTFDAGGISIKPGAAMDEMKYDMCGGASVIGVMRTCLALKLPINLVGVVPSSENLPDGDANKPGDILTSMAGKTIEVLNTDAEGRLILCDAITYSERFEPQLLIDIATLTGACVIALGKHPSGLFSNDDELADELLTAGESSGDRVWRMPLWEEYQSQLDSNFADMANVGGREGGAITAACFLSRFTGKMRWAHLDIAGTAWLSGERKGATGRPVPLLTRFLLRRCGLGE